MSSAQVKKLPTLTQELLKLTNNARKKAGLSTLTPTAFISDSSHKWSRSMASKKSLAHDKALKKGFKNGWTFVGENLAKAGDTVTAQRIFDAWLASPGHKKNIYRADFTHFGIASVESKGTVWVTQRFAAYPRVRLSKGKKVTGVMTAPASGALRKADYNGDNLADLLVVTSAGKLRGVYGDGRAKVFHTRTFDTGTFWSTVRLGTAVGDVNKDGANDIVTVTKAGSVFLHRGTGTGPLQAKRKIASGWKNIRLLASPGDVTGDGIPDLVAVHKNGKVLVYPMTKSGNLKAPRVVARDGKKVVRLLGTGDITGDKRADFVMVMSNGKLVTMAGKKGVAKFSRSKQYSSGWKGRKVFSIGDINGDGRGDIIRVKGKTAYVYLGKGKNSWSAAKKMGTIPSARLVF